MANYRTILATLIALAVALAPVLVANNAFAKAPAAHDCHGKTPKDAKSGGCPDCDTRNAAKCPGDGSKCCKLTGAIAVLPLLAAPIETLDAAANPQALTGWLLRPRPPPPRT